MRRVCNATQHFKAVKPEIEIEVIINPIRTGGGGIPCPLNKKIFIRSKPKIS